MMSSVQFVVRRKNDDVQHYKYIKKEKINGKWRYFYDIGEQHGTVMNSYTMKPEAPNDVTGINSNVKSYTKLQDLLGMDEKDRFERTATQVKLKNERLYDLSDQYRTAKWRVAEKKYEQAGREFTKARNAYMKTPISVLDSAKDAINKGKKAVAGMLRKLANKLD